MGQSVPLGGGSPVPRSKVLGERAVTRLASTATPVHSSCPLVLSRGPRPRLAALAGRRWISPFISLDGLLTHFRCSRFRPGALADHWVDLLHDIKTGTTRKNPRATQDLSRDIGGRKGLCIGRLKVLVGRAPSFGRVGRRLGVISKIHSVCGLETKASSKAEAEETQGHAQGEVT